MKELGKKTERWCKRCDGRGSYYHGHGLGYLHCESCEGEGRVPWTDEWRPVEQCKENFDGTHLRGDE